MTLAINDLRLTLREELHAFARENFYVFYRLMSSVILPWEPFLPSPHFKGCWPARWKKVAKGETRAF